MTEQQTHLKQLLDQQNDLIKSIQELNNQLNLKKELALKIQGAIEYLQQIGVTLSENQESNTSEKNVDESVSE